jgi:hypothetical protein
VVEDASNNCSDAAHQGLVIFAAGAVPDQARDLGLMHGEDHRGRGAGATERVAHLGDVEDRSAEAAELDRDLRAEQLALARRVDRSPGEASLLVHVLGIRARHRGDLRGPLRKRRSLIEQRGRTVAVLADFRFLNVHARRLRGLSACTLRWQRDAHGWSDCLRLNPEAMNLIQIRR